MNIASPTGAIAPSLVFAFAAAWSAVGTAAPVDDFLARLAPLCDQAYAGRIVANEPASTTPDPFANQPLVMHVRECGDAQWKIAFHVGEDRSRTWVLTRTADGLRLKHDHRHEDGTPDAVTMYGGETAATGTATRQEFPVDAESIAMFEREGRSASVTNVWAMEIEPGARFVYELSRPDGRLFRVEFDLTRPVDAPPPPWGTSSAGRTWDRSVAGFIDVQLAATDQSRLAHAFEAPSIACSGPGAAPVVRRGCRVTQGRSG